MGIRPFQSNGNYCNPLLLKIQPLYDEICNSYRGVRGNFREKTANAALDGELCGNCRFSGAFDKKHRKSTKDLGEFTVIFFSEGLDFPRKFGIMAIYMTIVHEGPGRALSVRFTKMTDRREPSHGSSEPRRIYDGGGCLHSS